MSWFFSKKQLELPLENFYATLATTMDDNRNPNKPLYFYRDGKAFLTFESFRDYQDDKKMLQDEKRQEIALIIWPKSTDTLQKEVDRMFREKILLITTQKN